MDKMSKAEFINIISFSQLLMWDVKRHLIHEIQSSFPLIPLSELIKENNNKVKLNEYPDKEFGILGVNNVDGLFDAYTEIGKKISQSYKKMEANELAYNPYRINVGSIGMKTSFHKNEYISPAYIVFRCNEKLNPEYLYKLFKTNNFDRIINENTTGSVRQNLKFDTLKNIKIPLPPLSDQNRIVEAYNKKIKQAEELEKKATETEDNIGKYIDKELGIEFSSEVKSITSTKFLKLISYSQFIKWGVDKQKIEKVRFNKNFETKRIIELCNVSSGGTPSRSRKEYYTGNIPWIKTTEVRNDVIYDTEEKITDDAINNSSAKLYPKDSLIIAMYGQGATRGRTAKLGIEASTNQACAVLYNIDNSIIDTDYLWIYLMHEYERLRALASGNNQPNLNAQMIKNYEVVIPPFDIQQKIKTKVQEKKAEIKKNQEKSEELKLLALKDFENEIFKPCN